jgi:putative addiction module CopG family antidote
MSITLTPQLESRIHEKVAAGIYPDAIALIERAMVLLDAHDAEVERLRAAIREGEAGEATPYTPELLAEIDREADELLRSGAQIDPDVAP